MDYFHISREPHPAGMRAYLSENKNGRDNLLRCTQVQKNGRDERCIRCGEPIPRPLPKDAESLCDACYMRGDLVYDACDEEDYYEEKQPIWPLRFLPFVMAPFLAVGTLLLMVGVFLLGSGFVAVGLMSLPSNPVLGWILFAWGVGIWLCMIGKGINAMFGGR